MDPITMAVALSSMAGNIIGGFGARKEAKAFNKEQDRIAKELSEANESRINKLAADTNAIQSWATLQLKKNARNPEALSSISNMYNGQINSSNQYRDRLISEFSNIMVNKKHQAVPTVASIIAGGVQSGVGSGLMSHEVHRLKFLFTIIGDFQ